ncbi:MAG: hypothetical protein K1X33_06870 [Methanobacteriaceae archaeon]|nr:hypothetical protein [Methanobacteriaceae archaeon]
MVEISEEQKEKIREYYKEKLNVPNLEFEALNDKFINIYSDEINLNDVQPGMEDLEFIEKILNAKFQGIKNTTGKFYFNFRFNE